MHDYKYRTNNCYRAILAQVNYLDGIYTDKNRLKALYEELSILAFYMMEDDHEGIMKSISEIKDLSREMEITILDNPDNKDNLSYIFGEIKTHLDYLSIEYCHCS